MSTNNTCANCGKEGDNRHPIERPTPRSNTHMNFDSISIHDEGIAEAVHILHNLNVESNNNEENITKCASCGNEGGDNMNACNKCDLVAYCNAACKKKHRSRHKKKCEKRAAELHDKELFKEPPPREECGQFAFYLCHCKQTR